MKITFIVAILLSTMLPAIAGAQSFDEAAVTSQFNQMQTANNTAAAIEQWIQPVNRKEKCKIRWGSSDIPTITKWYGDCLNGKANGLGISILKLNGAIKSATAIEEYDYKKDKAYVAYRQINELSSGDLVIISGVSFSDSTKGQSVVVGKSREGNMTVRHDSVKCESGKCVKRRTEPLTGTIIYQLSENGRYSVDWYETKASNKLLYNRRILSLNGVIRADKMIIDGNVIDVGMDIQSGRSSRVEFSDTMNKILAKPFENYVSNSGEIDEALRLSNEKFISAHNRFCAPGKINDEDVRKICNPSSLIPSEETLSTAQREENDVYQKMYSDIRSSIETFRNNAANQQQQQQLLLQQEQLEQIKRQENQQALQRSIRALGQMGRDMQDAGQQMLNQTNQNWTPQVQTPSLSRPPIIHCRTIGYITTCN